MPDNLVIPRTRDSERIVRAVKRVEAMPAVLPPRHDAPDRFLDSVPFLNETGEDLDDGVAVWLDGMESNAVQQAGRTPYCSGITQFGITCNPVPTGIAGRAWINGMHPARVAAADWAGIKVGDRLSPTGSAQPFMPNKLGPLLVTGKLASPFIRVLFVFQRGNHVFTRTMDGSLAHPLQVWLLMAPLSHEEVSPGHGRINIA